MRILLLGNLPETPAQVSWIESQTADLIIFARDTGREAEPISTRSWVIRFAVGGEKLECFQGNSHGWRYELRHIRLTGSSSDDRKSIPVVFLPWPSPCRDDDWFTAAKQQHVDISAGKEPWILVTHGAFKEANWPESTEILTLDLSDIARARIAVCGVTRAPKNESRWLRIDARACDGPVPHHAWVG